MFQNTVYPLYHHGEYVIHHTPGKRWDSFYTWDSGFIGLDMLEFSPKIADYILDLYLSDKDNKDYAFCCMVLLCPSIFINIMKCSKSI